MSENGPRSKQGTLFKQIRETEFADIPLQTFIDYAGFKRGIETFVKIIERENRIIPTDFDDESTSF
ncbi:MAG: hypothetical protein JST51_11730, partial [Armatimonadetes bacterium]|nr:hypothetical protein [Armatimonadota bacterium]